MSKCHIVGKHMSELIWLMIMIYWKPAKEYFDDKIRQNAVAGMLWLDEFIGVIAL